MGDADEIPLCQVGFFSSKKGLSHRRTRLGFGHAAEATRNTDYGPHVFRVR
jgi:hypothetical protein